MRFVLAAILVLLAAIAYAGSGYHVINRLQLGGEGGWDYFTVDSEHQLLYVPRSANDIDRFYSEAPRTLALSSCSVISPRFGRPSAPTLL